MEDLSSGCKSEEVFSGKRFNEQHFLLEAEEDSLSLSLGGLKSEPDLLLFLSGLVEVTAGQSRNT